jgi:hypothetical protein
VLAAYSAYCGRAQEANWGNTKPERTARDLLAPILGLFHGTPASKAWRQAVMAASADAGVLQAQPVPMLIQRCVDALLASPIGDADAILDHRPTFSPGALPAEQEPPPRPCRVRPDDRAGGPDERRPRASKSRPAEKGGRKAARAGATEERLEPGASRTTVNIASMPSAVAPEEPMDECAGLEGRAAGGGGAQGDGLTACHGTPASLGPSARDLLPVVACVIALALAIVAGIPRRRW